MPLRPLYPPGIALSGEFSLALVLLSLKKIIEFLSQVFYRDALREDVFFTVLTRDQEKSNVERVQRRRSLL